MNQMKSGLTTMLGNSSGRTQAPQDPQGQLDAANSDRRVSDNLSNAINSCRSHTSSTVFSPPTTSTVQEAQGSYCDSTPAQNLVQAGYTQGGIKFFLSKDLESQRKSIHEKSQLGTDLFSFLLHDLAAIFEIPAANLHIFLDPSSKSIAFNFNGALFFNYHYFETLHLATISSSRDKKIEAVAYWWVTFCHELAHNLAKNHNAEHSFYTESFASHYFAKAMDKALQY